MTDLDEVADRVLTRIGRWTVRNWAVRDRAQRVYDVVQELADLGADAERRRRLVVPRLADTVLPDQLAVLVHDLRTADEPTKARAAEALRRLG